MHAQLAVTRIALLATQHGPALVQHGQHIACSGLSRMLLQLCMLPLDQCAQAVPQSVSLSWFISRHKD